MDAVYRVRVGRDNEELRYSLRSLAAHLPVDRVWIAGYCPPWVTGVEVLPVQPVGSKYMRSLACVLAACEARDVSERFFLFDDDFFVLQPVHEMPVLHRGPIAEVFPGRPDRTYRAGMWNALRLLNEWGIEVPLCYELHIPMVLSKHSVLHVTDRADDRIPAVASQIRSLVGNVDELGGEQIDDVKIAALRAPVDLEEMAFVSTADQAFNRGLVGQAIRERFPEPSPFER